VIITNTNLNNVIIVKRAIFQNGKLFMPIAFQSLNLELGKSDFSE